MGASKFIQKPQSIQRFVSIRDERFTDLVTGKVIPLQNQAAVAMAESELADSGRVVLRASGTEPVIRVMVEGEDHDQVVSIANRLAAVVAESAA